jgi:hypothetical protein
MLPDVKRVGFLPPKIDFSGIVSGKTFSVLPSIISGNVKNVLFHFQAFEVARASVICLFMSMIPD